MKCAIQQALIILLILLAASVNNSAYYQKSMYTERKKNHNRFILSYYITQLNKAKFPQPTSLHQKTVRRNTAQKASEADSYQFLRMRKNIEMVQTKHCDDQNQRLRWFKPTIAIFGLRFTFFSSNFRVGNFYHSAQKTDFYRITPLILLKAQSRQLCTHEIRYFGKNH